MTFIYVDISANADSIYLLCKFDICLAAFDIINPSCAAAHIECVAHIDSQREISKIPQGIYIDVLEEIIKKCSANAEHFLYRPKVELISWRTEVRDELL